MDVKKRVSVASAVLLLSTATMVGTALAQSASSDASVSSYSSSAATDDGTPGLPDTGGGWGAR